MHGAVEDPTARDSLAAVNDGVPANATVMRPATSFDAGRPLILIVMQVPGVVCPCHGCCFKLQRFIRETWYPTGKAAHGGRCRTDRQRRHHRVRGRARLEPPSEYPLHSSELEYRQGVTVSLHFGSLPGAVGDASLLNLVMF